METIPIYQLSTSYHELKKSSQTNKLLTLLSICITNEQVKKLNQYAFEEFKAVASKDLIYFTQEAKEIESSCRRIISEGNSVGKLPNSDLIIIQTFLHLIETQKKQEIMHFLEQEVAMSLTQNLYEKCFQLFFKLIQYRAFDTRIFRNINDKNDLNQLIDLEKKLEKIEYSSKRSSQVPSQNITNIDDGKFNPFLDDVIFVIESFPKDLEIFKNPNITLNRYFEKKYYFILEYNYNKLKDSLIEERESNHLCLACSKKLSFIEKMISYYCTKHRQLNH